MNKYKPLLLSLFILGVFITAIDASQAADANVICSDSCSSIGSPLFSEANMAPGKSVTKTLEIKNDRTQPIHIALVTTQQAGTDDAFLDKINVQIVQQGGLSKFINTLKQLFLTEVSLGTIASNTISTYDMTLSFDQNADNNYQGKVANFDLAINISGEDQTQTITSIQTSSSTDENNDDDDNDDEGAVLADTVGTGLGAAILGAIDKMEYQLFEEESPENANLPTEVATLGEVAGVHTVLCPFWWIVLIAQTIILAGLYYLSKRNKNKTASWWLMTAIVVLLGNLVDWYAHTHWFEPSTMCRYELLLATALALSQTGLLDWIARLRAKKTQPS